MAISWHISSSRPFRFQIWQPLLTQAGNNTANMSGSASSATDLAMFESFVHQYERLILNYLWRMSGEEQSAYDLTQETFLRAWIHFAKIQTYQNPRAWLLRVATNLALSHRARRQGPVGLALPLTALNDPGSSDPGRHVAESEMVRLTLQTLAPKQRALLVLREVYGLSIDELAGVMAMSHDAVKMALSRAREQFRTTYEREDRQS